MDSTFDFVGALLLPIGAVLLFKTRKRNFDRTNAYGVERFSSYWNKLRARTSEGFLGGLSVLLLSSGTLLLAFRYQESWGWIVLFPVCLIMLPYTITQMANDLAALLDHLQIPTAHLLGWSMGGVIAQSFALAHPTRVHQLLLLGTFTAADGYFHEAISNWRNMRRSNMPYEQTVRHLARMVYSSNLARNPTAYEAFVQVMLANPYRQTDHGFFRQAEALLAYKAPPTLAELRLPTSILVGEHDQLTPRYMSEELAAALPGASLQVLPGAHAGFLEYPNDYNQAILNILRGGSPRDLLGR